MYMEPFNLISASEDTGSVNSAAGRFRGQTRLAAMSSAVLITIFDFLHLGLIVPARPRFAEERVRSLPLQSAPGDLFAFCV